MPASLFCEHKRLVSVCPLCGAARAGGATPVRTAVTHDVDDTIHALRTACHGRLRDYITRVHKGEDVERAYWSVYDALERRGKVHSEEEDPATFRGGFYRGMIKMFDITIDGRRIQGYNGLADWDEMRDYVFRKFAPDELAAAMKQKRLTIHGGNCAWPRQQIATELIRTERVREAVLLLAFGSDGKTCGDVSEGEIVRRLDAVEKMEPKSLSLSTKVLHVFCPTRFPPLTPRATPEVGEELGFPIPDVQSSKDYLGFAESMRELARAKGHADLGRTDMLLADTWDMLQG
jgi:hypothetical protein